MQQALTIALAATEGVRQERRSEIFLAKTPEERSVREHDPCADMRQNRFSKSAPIKPRQGPEVRCYECDGRVHYARECPTRSRRESKPRDSPRNKDPSRRSTQPSQTRNRPGSAKEPDTKKGTRNQGNE